MVLPDVNVLIAAYRVDSLEHERCRTWLMSVVNGDHAFAVSELVLSGFVRIVTNPRVFDHPSSLASALEYVDTIRGLDHCVDLRPGERHWKIFARLCEQGPKREGTWSQTRTTRHWPSSLVRSGLPWTAISHGFLDSSGAVRHNFTK